MRIKSDEIKGKTPMNDAGTAVKALVADAPIGLNRRMETAQTDPSLKVVKGDEDSSPARFRALMLAVALEKDKEAFAELFGYFAPRIKSFLMKGGASPDVADELAQETMITVWQKAASFDPAKASASTWIFTIARNKRIDALRKAVRPEFNAEDPNLVEDDAPSAPEQISQAEETDHIAAAIKSLPAEQADLLYKAFFEDKTHADIADETKLPLGTVKSRIRLALDKLRADRTVKDLWI